MANGEWSDSVWISYFPVDQTEREWHGPEILSEGGEVSRGAELGAKTVHFGQRPPGRQRFRLGSQSCVRVSVLTNIPGGFYLFFGGYILTFYLFFSVLESDPDFGFEQAKQQLQGMKTFKLSQNNDKILNHKLFFVW